MTLIVYHRGGGKSLGYPPNSILAIRWALGRSAAAIEYDVCVTRVEDRFRMIVVEPKLLLRCRLDIDALNWNDVRVVDAGNETYGPCGVSTLKEVLALVDGTTHQQIHIKGADPHTVPALLDEIGGDLDCLLTSFSLNTLGVAKRISPRTRTGWIVKPDGESGSEGADDLTATVAAGSPAPYTTAGLASIRHKARDGGVDVVILCAPQIPSRDAISFFRRDGFEVGGWGVGTNLGLAKRLIDFEIDRFTIDNPEQL